MKHLLILTGMFFFGMLSQGFSANRATIVNDTLTTSFKVNGTLQSKAAIESALTSKPGVISATWEVSTKQVTVKYLSPQLQKTDLYTYVALAGFDTDELKAKKEKYDALPNEHKYVRDPETE